MEENSHCKNAAIGIPSNFSLAEIVILILEVTILAGI
jgi:hypothetical protein